MSLPLKIDPPLLNSANPWATTYDDVLALYRCPHLGAVTTRTSTLEGFPHDDSIHKYAFFDPRTHISNVAIGHSGARPEQSSTVNNLGYSPIPLEGYLTFIERISRTATEDDSLRRDKPFIISVTGTPIEVATCFTKIQDLASKIPIPLAMEINLSCPNIPNKPPPAYASSSLKPYLDAIIEKVHANTVPVGLKLPPYTYADQFAVISTTLASTIPCPVSFLTSTNTLGSSLLLTPTIPTSANEIPYAPALSPTFVSASDVPVSPLGGLAGSALHPLALGNVYSLRNVLARNPELKNIQIIGVGGVEDAEGYKRMRCAGAAAVGVGTGLGRSGIGIFEKIAKAWEV